jgi:hypothetical protein
MRKKATISFFKYIFFLLLLFTGSRTCAQNRIDSMKNTTMKVVSYLVNKDTAKLSAMFLPSSQLKNHTETLMHDAISFQTIVKKYGMPKKNQIKTDISKSGETVFYITLMERNDSALNIKKAVLYVTFPPEQFKMQVEKIYNYGLAKYPLTVRKRNLELIRP